MDEEAVLSQFKDGGFEEVRRTKKVVEFRGPRTAQSVYFERKVGLPAAAKIVLHPSEATEYLGSIAGVEVEPAGNFHHHSNMTAFPTRQNGGRAPIPYGKPVRVGSTQALAKLIAALSLGYVAS